MSIQAILYGRGNEVVTISPAAPAAEAAEMLAAHNVAALAVVEAGAILGFVSGHEIIQAWSRHHRDLSAVTVMDIMDPGVVSVSPDDSLKRVMTLFVRHSIRHVAVLRDGKLVGLISAADVARQLIEDFGLKAPLGAPAVLQIGGGAWPSMAPPRFKSAPFFRSPKQHQAIRTEAHVETGSGAWIA